MEVGSGVELVGEDVGREDSVGVEVGWPLLVGWVDGWEDVELEVGSGVELVGEDVGREGSVGLKVGVFVLVGVGETVG